jgi:hypothetical protein
VPDDPTSIPTERMPELVADIRLVPDGIRYMADDPISTHPWGLKIGRAAISQVFKRDPHHDELMAAYDRLKAAFGKDE